MTLAIHNLRPSRGAKHAKKKIGRGNASGHGTSSTRGGKGQTARSGGSRGLRMKGFKFLLQSTPKLGGFKSLATKPTEVRLSDLEKKFSEGEVVNVASLKAKKLIGVNDKAAKILNTGELKKKLVIEGVKCTAKAKELIEKVGGSVK